MLNRQARVSTKTRTLPRSEPLQCSRLWIGNQMRIRHTA